MSGTLLNPGVIRRRGSVTPRGAISQSGILTRPSMEWSPLDANPLLLLDAALGSLKSGGTPAGYLEPVATWENQGTGASDATQTSETYQPLYLPHDGNNYLHLPGVEEQNAELANFTLNTTNFQITLHLRRRSWTGSEPNQPPILARWSTVNGQRAWNVSFNSGGVFSMLVSSDGNTGASVATRTSTSGVPFTDGTWGWIRITGTASNVKFETSSDGTSWTQLGDLLSAFPSAHYAAPVNFSIGTYSSGVAPVSNTSVRLVRIVNGSTPVLHLDFAKVPGGTSSFTCDTGQTVSFKEHVGASVLGAASLRFNGSNNRLSGTLSETLTKGRFFIVGKFRSIVGGGRIFSTASEEETDEDDTGAVWFYQAGADQPAVYFADGYKMARGSGYVGRYVWETYLNGTANLSRIGGNQQTSSASSASLASTRYSIAEAIGGESPLNGAGDIEYIALFPANLSALNVSRMRAYLTRRFGLPA
jgi:hypothetical protein